MDDCEYSTLHFFVSLDSATMMPGLTRGNFNGRYGRRDRRPIARFSMP